MVRRLILFTAAFAIAGVAFLIYQAQEGGVRRQQDPLTQAPPRERTTAKSPATQPMGSSNIQEQGISFQGAVVRAGEAPKFTFFDKQGNERIVFSAARAQPIGDTEFHVTDLDARLRLPGGQLVYVKADEGQIVVQRTDTGNFNAKNGQLRGRVYIIIDRTTPEWRKANPALAEPDQHPEQVVKMWLDDLFFDLDLAHMKSQGPIQVQSSSGTMEGEGLDLIWNEVNRRITLLKISKGKRAVLRGKELGDFNLSNDIQVEETPAGEQSTSAGHPAGRAEAQAEATKSRGKPPVAAAAKQPHPVPNAPATGKVPLLPGTGTLEFAELDESADLKRDRVDSYVIEFHGDVVAKQKEGVKVAGMLQADLLRLIADFGEQERDAVRHAPDTQPAAGSPAVADRDRRAPSTDTLAQAGRMLELQWSGELQLKPQKSSAASQPAEAAKRFHVIAQGDPVRLMDRKQGKAVCRELEYHDESKQIWLRGTKEQPVITQAGQQREVSGETVFLDRKTGLAVIEGPGYMLDRRASADDEAGFSVDRKGAGNEATAKQAKEGQATWSRRVEINFGQATRRMPNPSGGPPITTRREYLKSAVFEGNARLTQAGQQISADHLTIAFREPDAAADVSVDNPTDLKAVVAKGNIQMTNGTDSVACQRLEADMSTDETGRSYPRVARAYGNVVARQGQAEIRARDHIEIAMATVPRPITPQERARFEARAQAEGIRPGTPKWNAIERKLRDRREVVIRSMTARGEVAGRDPKNELAMNSEQLACTFGDNRNITQATLLGTEQMPAGVQTSDFHIRGPRINIDTVTQSVDVPGAGLLRFFTAQDLNGEPVSEPIPIAVTWEQSMTMRGQDNAGTFIGEVRARSRNIKLDCRELRIDFKDIPRPAEAAAAAQPAGAAPRWNFGALVEALKPRKQESFGAQTSRQIRKRPSYLHAIGDAVLESQAFEEAGKRSEGVIAHTLNSWFDKAMPQRAQQRKSQTPQRLASRLRIAGPKIGVDLIQEHLGVEGQGNLLVEDYQLPSPGKGRPTAGLTGSRLGETSMGALESSGPSQTLFTWKTSLLFLSNRNIARFDNAVTMRHASGSRMVLSEAEARAMNFDLSRLGRIPGRQVSLSCDNLMAEFERPKDQARAEAPRNSLVARATRLKSLQASGRSVRMEEGNRAAEGTRISYDGQSGIVKLAGSPQVPARVMEWDELGGVHRVLRNELIEWNQRTGQIEIRGPSVLATGR